MKIKILTIMVLTSMSPIGFSESNQSDTDNHNETKGTGIYEIKKHTISSGGGVSTGGIYSLTSSIGQIDAGHNATGGIYEFNGGFLTGNSDLIFKNGFD